MKIKEQLHRDDCSAVYLTEDGKLLQHTFHDVEIVAGGMSIYKKCDKWEELTPKL